MIRRDRYEFNRGECLLCSKSNINVIDQPELNEDLGPYIQIIWAKIRTPHDEFLLGLCYNSPKSTSEQIEPMNKNIERANKTHKCIIICGDFNFLGINWETLKSNKKSEGFLQTTMNCFLTVSDYRYSISRRSRSNGQV